MKSLYASEIKSELAKWGNHNNQDIITENDIAGLPEPVQRFFRNCGYLGKVKMHNAEIKYENVYIKMAPDKNWVGLECYQFNSVPEPCRIVYMKSRLMGIFPFEGRDKCQDGHGNMRIKLLKLFQVADVKGKEMDQSALVTVLAETFFVPTYALQDYIKWTAVDANTAKAVLSYNNNTVSGLFYFNEHGEFIRFETDDRYYTEKGNEFKRLKWSAVVGNYIDKNGLRMPSYLKGIWHKKEGDYEYFKGNITDIIFNVR